MNVIQAVVFGDGEVSIQYMTIPEDVRNKGLLVMTRNLVVTAGESADYAEEIETLKAAAQALLADALEDFASTPALELDDDVSANEGWQGLPGEYDDDEEQG